MDDATAQKLMAMMERLANQGPPVVNVNISLPDSSSSKKKRTINGPEEQQTPQSSGYPRPYTS